MKNITSSWRSLTWKRYGNFAGPKETRVLKQCVNVFLCYNYFYYFVCICEQNMLEVTRETIPHHKVLRSLCHYKKQTSKTNKQTNTKNLKITDSIQKFIFAISNYYW